MPDATPPRAPTGTGTDRRPLELHEALAGALPDPYTDEEWRALHEGSGRQAGVLTAKCDACGEPADSYVEGWEMFVCESCGVQIAGAELEEQEDRMWGIHPDDHDDEWWEDDDEEDEP